MEECEEGNYIVFLPNSETQIVRVNDRDETRVINILLENESILKKNNQNGFVLYGVFVYQTGRIFDDNFPVFSFVTNVVKSSLSICIRSAPMFSIHCCSISATIFLLLSILTNHVRLKQ